MVMVSKLVSSWERAPRNNRKKNSVPGSNFIAHAGSYRVLDYTWEVQADLAFIRGGSPFRCLDMLRWLRDGTGTFAATEHMSASLLFREDGVAEIGHVAGEWHDDEARWLYERMWRAMRARGVDEWEWNGRKGWMRFLQGKGWLK